MVHFADASRRNPATTSCDRSSVGRTETGDYLQVTCRKCLKHERYNIAREMRKAQPGRIEALGAILTALEAA